MNADDLDDLDRAILDYLQREPSCEKGWGMATPSLVHAVMKDERGDVPVRQTINNRMKRLELAGHLENPYDKGVYRFVSDPREGTRG